VEAGTVLSGALLGRVDGEGFSKKVAFEQRYKESEAASHMDIRGQIFPGRESSKCKGPEAEAFQVLCKDQLGG
jgi:hypothetical protein